MKNESDFTRKFCEVLTKCNCKCTAFVGSMMQAPGIPDRHVFHHTFPQKQVWIESKMNDGRLSPGQRLWCRGAVDAGAHVVIMRYEDGWVSIEDVYGVTLAYARWAALDKGNALRELIKSVLVTETSSA